MYKITFPEHYRTATGRTIIALIDDRFTTIRQFCEILGVTTATVHSWLRDSAVPVAWVGKVSRLLKCHPAVLNYEHWIDLRMDKAAEFFDLVEAIKVGQDVKKYIKASRPPSKQAIINRLK